MSKLMFLGTAMLCASLTLASSGAAKSASIKSSDLEVATPLTDDDGKVATDISGVSCLPGTSDKRFCLFIDDQGRLAQAATIEGSKLKAGGKIRIFGDRPPADIVGQAPTESHCKKKDDFKDLDGEAVAYDQKFFYVVGSHGCSRNSDKFRTSSFILAKIPEAMVSQAAEADPKAIAGDKIFTTYRLSEALLLAPTVKGKFANNLKTDNGLNIEGLAVVEGKLYAGLRAPLVGSKAYLIAVNANLLFDAKRPLAPDDVKEIDFDLGGRAIRDLAVLADRRLLVLSGPAQEQSVSFALHAVDPETKAVEPIAELTDIPSGRKAEAVYIFGEKPALDVLVAFDEPESGAPRRYLIER